MRVDRQTWFCDGSLNPKSVRHPFDVAKQGYINLLPVQNKKSKSPGDGQASILARQRFLQAGFYQPLQSKLYQLIQKHLKKTYLQANINNTTWLDIGCGEGYYSQKIATIPSINQLIALDISKPAVIELAKASKCHHILWCQSQAINKQTHLNELNQGIVPLVASASKLPLKDSCLGGVSSIFSPIFPHEIYRVLSDKGIVCIAKPDVGHLASMRVALFDEVREHQSDKFLWQLDDAGFTLLEKVFVTTEFKMNQQQLADLLTMTPYSYRAKRIKREDLLLQADAKGFKTTAKFVLYVLQKA